MFDSAVSKRKPDNTLIFHSDQGCQFTSIDFMNKLKTLHVTQSFSSPGVPYDNAAMESFFSSLKRESLYVDNTNNLEELTNTLESYVNYYNNLRPHKTLAFLSPNQYENGYFSKEKQD